MRIFNLMLLVALLLIPVLTLAKGPANVANGVHNLSVDGVDPYWGSEQWGTSLYATDEDQVCVFCHTPHGGSLIAPLWNKSAPTSAWSHYNSATMSIDPGLSVGRAPNSESLICLACHDGSLSVNHVTNLPNDRNGALIESWGGDDDVRIYADIITGDPGRRIGASKANSAGEGILSDDHPISFSYNQVLASDDYKSTGSKYQTLKSVTAAEDNGNGVRFFTGDNNVECSSCHDPHVDYISDPAYSPFLIMPNSGSALCLACHTK